MTSPVLHIAIDGPVGSGKSAISSSLAKQIGITYLYTGAMYRAVAYACIASRVNPRDKNNVLELFSKTTIQLDLPSKKSNFPVKVILDNEDVTGKLFTPSVDEVTPIVSSLSEVRKEMVKLQRVLAQGKSVVMEGRDIGLRVLPQAQLKIYLTASLDERANRRWLQFKEKGIEKSREEVLKDTKLRDFQDTTRSTDPLQKLPDAWELDTTGMTQEEVVGRIKEELTKRKLL